MSADPTGSPADMLDRLKAVLPIRWFPDATPVLDGLLAGLAATASTLYGMLAYVRLQTRLGTATDSFLDTAASDYCGTRVWRRVLETDLVLRGRIKRELLRSRATRSAVAASLSDLTGRSPQIFEPAQSGDIGGWNVARGYGTAGTWGSLSMPFQALVVAYRPFPAGAPAWTGGAGPGAPVAGLPVVGGVSDAEIYAAVAATMPVATVVWTAIRD